MNAQLQYRAQRQRSAATCFPTLGGATSGHAASACRWRSTSRTGATMHAINVNFTRSTSAKTINRYADRRGRRRRRRHHGASRPIRSTGACRRCRSRRSRACATSRRRAGSDRGCPRRYTWTRPLRSAQLPFGGDFSHRLVSDSQTDANARGASSSPGSTRPAAAPIARERRPRLRRLPARPAAAGDAPVRPGQRPHARPVAERVLPGRLAARARS